SLGIGAAEFRELMFGLALRNQQITAVGSREKILRTPLDYAKPVIVELQIPDDLRVKQAHRVGGDRVAEAGIKLLRYRRAAYDAAPLKTLNFHPRQAEIGGAGEAVVSRTDDHGVIGLHRQHLPGPLGTRRDPPPRTIGPLLATLWNECLCRPLQRRWTHAGGQGNTRLSWTLA